ncbi:hypothetical protein [Aphanizomenon flos-aquae]|uniref:hypothetical protein n=1 Tax=Aphanizomenon flos-aquae TaxID=1176 RepID=UPI0004AF45F7|nr:hypothetical protein [Aphanizomenon flos-aquae]
MPSSVVEIITQSQPFTCGVNEMRILCKRFLRIASEGTSDRKALLEIALPPTEIKSK